MVRDCPHHRRGPVHAPVAQLLLRVGETLGTRYTEDRQDPRFCFLT